jgi:hypothetical protein
MAKITYTTRIKGFGNNTGIEVSAAALEELGAGKRPPVKVTIGDYSYQSSVGAMGGVALVSLPKAHREAAGVGTGDEVVVTLELESPNREVEVPQELQDALAQQNLMPAFAGLTYSKRKELCRQVAEAKTQETRDRRVAKVLAALDQ